MASERQKPAQAMLRPTTCDTDASVSSSLSAANNSPRSLSVQLDLEKARNRKLQEELEETQRKLLCIQREFIETFSAGENHDGYLLPPQWVRVVLVAVLAVYIIGTSKALESRPHVQQIYDLGHATTEALSDWLHERRFLRNSIVAVHAWLMDGFCLSIICIGICLDKSLHSHVGTFTFYTLRNICQQTMMFPLPPKWRFYDPGVPSILISFEEVSDFYFSGHTGAVFLLTLEFQRRGWRRCFYFGLVLTAVTAALMITTRAHYTVDIIDGLFFAWVSKEIALAYSRDVDHFFARLCGVTAPPSAPVKNATVEAEQFHSLRCRVAATYESVKRNLYAPKYKRWDDERPSVLSAPKLGSKAD